MNRQDVALILVVLGLIFLFQGDPDVWDKLRDRAMATETCK